MGKIIVVVLATVAALWLTFLLVGPRLGEHAFNVPHFGWNITWTMVAGACLGGIIYKIVKGK